MMTPTLWEYARVFLNHFRSYPLRSKVQTQQHCERLFPWFIQRDAWCPYHHQLTGDSLGTNTGGGPFHQRRPAGKRQY